MAIFGFKKRKDEKLEQNAQAAKAPSEKKGRAKSAKAKGSGSVSMIAETKASKAPKTTKISVPVASGASTNVAAVIIRPRITEKSGILSQGGVYTFEVMRNANKATVSKAVTALYKVTPVKVAMINTPIKNIFVKGRKGSVAGIRKAIVTVKKGDKIDFV